MSEYRIISRFKAQVARLNQRRSIDRQDWFDHGGLNFEEIEFAFVSGDGNPLNVDLSAQGLRHSSESELSALFQTAIGDYMGRLQSSMTEDVAAVVALAEQPQHKLNDRPKYAVYSRVGKRWDVRLLDVPTAEEWASWPTGLVVLAVVDKES
ncbi:MAG: hypothetical protein V1738_05000 [Patescibacteria group bacterium]